MPADPQIVVVSESPRPVVRDRDSDAGRLEDSVKSWSREVVVAVRALVRRVTTAENATTALQSTITEITTAATSSVATPAMPSPRALAPVTAENIGTTPTAVGVFKEKVGQVLRLKKLSAGANIQIEDTGDEIRIGLRLLKLDTTYITPVGSVQMWPALLSQIPAGWLLCDGSVLNVADYPDLGALLGATYGGDGTTTFGVPDSRDRFPLAPAAAEDPGATGGTVQHKHGVGTLANSSDSAGTPAGSIDAHTSALETIAVGASPVLTGPATHTFTGTPLGNHSHTISGKTDVNEDLAASTATADVLPPFLKLAFIIKT